MDRENIVTLIEAFETTMRELHEVNGLTAVINQPAVYEANRKAAAADQALTRALGEQIVAYKGKCYRPFGDSFTVEPITVL